MTQQLMRCNTGIDLTVAEFLHFDAAGCGRHTVPARLHCELQHRHRDAHVAFGQSLGEDDGVWWMRWDDECRVSIELPYCLAKDPDWPDDAEEDDDLLCGLPAEHRGGHQWQLQAPSLEVLPGAHPVSETGRERLRKIPKPSGPSIRVHRYEYALAVKWPDLDRWLMIPRLSWFMRLRVPMHAGPDGFPRWWVELGGSP